MTGKVFEVLHRQTRERYALKCMEVRRFDSELLDDLRNEIALLKLVDHPHVIKLYEYFEDEQNMFLILELCEGGELFDRLHAQAGSHYDEAQAARLMYSMCAAISYIHFRGISHRDLKLENFIFESKDPDSDLKLIDFGLSHKYGTSLRRMHTMVGTPYYIAPEVLLQSADSDGYTSACDVWSLGVIAYMLLSGTPPFRGKRDREVLEAVRRGKFSMSGPKWEHVSLEAKDFVRSLLVFNPAKRPTAEQALKLPWLQRSRAAKRPRPLDPAVVSSLREFGQLSAFKRAALEAIAFSMSAQSIRDLRAQFAGLDADSHGIVSVPQFCDVLARHGASREEAVAIFHSIDQAQTGGISYTEFLAASLGRRLLLSRERIRDAFQRMDVDGTGFITRANLKVLLGDEWSPEKVDAMMGEVDTKGDGRIDFDEFLAAFTREGWREAEDVAAMEPPTAGTASGAGATSGGGGSSAQTSTGDVRSSSALSNGGATPMSVASNQRFFSGSGAGAERAAAAPGTAAAAAASPPPAPPPRRHTAEGSELGTAGLFRLGDGGLAGGRGGGVAAGGRTGLTVRLLDKAAPAEPGGLAAADALLLVVPSAAAAAAVDSGAILADRTQSDDTALVGALRRRASRPPLPSTFASSQLGRCGIGAGQGSSPPRATAASVQRALSHAESRGGHGGSPPSGVLVAPVARFATGVSPLLPLALAPLPPEPHDLEVCLLSDAPHGSGGGPVSPLALAGASDKMALGR